MYTLRYESLEKKENLLVFKNVEIDLGDQMILLSNLGIDFKEYMLKFSKLAKGKMLTLDEGVAGSRGIRPRG